MSVRLIVLMFFSVLFCPCEGGGDKELHGWELPLLPSFMTETDKCTAYDSAKSIPLLKTDHNEKELNKYIPRDLWFAIRNRTHSKPGHHQVLVADNPLWRFNYFDNLHKDEYMEKYVNHAMAIYLFYCCHFSLVLHYKALIFFFHTLQ
jgi:hypothetical protein